MAPATAPKVYRAEGIDNTPVAKVICHSLESLRS